MLQGNQISKQFKVECPPRVISAIVKSIKSAYASSQQHVKQHLREEVQPQAWGYDRWLTIDSELLDMADAMGIEKQWNKNTDKTHIGHTELHFKSFFMTAVRTNDVNRRPNFAQYRESFAQSNQGLLFVSERCSRSKKIWVALQHVPDTQTGMPQSVRAVFYDNEYKHACQAVDLLAIAHAHDSSGHRLELKPQVVVALKNG